MLDLLFLSVPFTDSTTPPAAPAIISGVAKANSFSSDFIDWNIEILKSEKPVLNAFRELSITNRVIDKQLLINKTNELVYKIKQKSPKFVGISVFTYNCLPVTKLLCLSLRIYCPEIKIILGGQGLANNGINSEYSWGEEALNQNLCDYWVKSEGERAIIAILNGENESNLFNTNVWTQIENLDEIPYPDYNDYNFNAYKKSIPITASRGCVRRCTFCDIHEHWKKFVYRDGISVANEMIYQATKFEIYRFSFTDSLLNGSMKAYRDLVTTLADYNRQADANKKITWSSQFIFRPIGHMTEQDWKLTAEAGAVSLSVGVESLSEEIRDHMKKKFSNKDIIENLEIMEKYGLSCTFLMIVGYVTETEKHIQETKKMVEKLKPFAGNTIESIQYGSTLGILPGTPLHRMYGEEIIPGKQENDWINLTTGSTLEKRLQWIDELKKHALKHGFNVRDDSTHQSLLERSKALL